MTDKTLTRQELLTLDGYQEQAAATALYPGAAEIIMEATFGAEINEAGQDLLGLVYLALGLAGEAGEFANKVKKILRDHYGRITEEMRIDLLDELGDNQWYLSQAARHLNCRLSTVAAMNLAKLQERRRTGRIGGSGDKR